MYVAKRNGSGYSRYHATEVPYSPARLTLIGELGDAVRGNQLEVQYLLRLDLQSGASSGIEALVRWRHPVRGLIMPGQFIPLA